MRPNPLVKICGIKTAEDAVITANLGTDYIGVVFDNSSKSLIAS